MALAQVPEAAATMVREYLRISDDPAHQSLSPMVQHVEIDRRVLTPRAFSVAASYVDRDRSAWQRGVRRDEFERMLEDVRRDPSMPIVAYDLDRLLRRMSDLERLIRLHEETGVIIVTASGELDLSSANGRAQARTLATFAEMSSDRTSERVKSHWAFKRSQGIPKWVRRPYGFNLDRTHNADEKAALHEAAKRLLAGESLSGIARDWQARSMVQTTGGQWTAQRLRVVLGSPRNAGYLTRRGNEIVGKGDWKPIFDERTWKRISARLADRSRVGATRAASYPYLLTGVIRCGTKGCNGHLTGSSRDGRPFYICAKHAPSGRDGCGKIKVSAIPTEKVLVDFVLDVVGKPANRKRIVKATDNSAATDDLAIKAERLEAEKQNLRDLAQLSGLDSDIRARIKANSAELEAVRAKLRHAHTASSLALLPEGDDLRATWDALGIDRQRAVVSDLVDAVVIKPATTMGRNFDASRVAILRNPVIEKAIRK